MEVEVGGDRESDEVGATEPASDGSLPTWSGRQIDAGHRGEIVDATLWLDAAEGGDPARANAVSAKKTVDLDPGVVRASQAVGPTPPSSAAGERGKRRRRVVMVLIGTAAALALAGFAGWAFGRASVSSVETAGAVDEEGSTQGATESDADGDHLVAADESSAETSTGTAGAGATTQTSAQETVDVADGESNESEPFVVPETPDNPSGATQYAVMAGGKAVMRGWYPTASQAKSAVADAAVIMGGMENVIDETQVDPRAQIRPDGFAVYLQDFILFEFDSAEITSEFYEFLGFPLFFMQNNPAATVTVVARTDARGSEAYNLELATRRAEAVRDHWLTNGGNADQIILDPRGEEDADKSADDEQAALDRRVELRVSGFLAG